MLPVIQQSKLTAKDFLNQIQTADFAPDWMKKLFSVDGTNLKLAQRYTYPNSSKPPGWFGTWHTSVRTALEANEWELTTGALELLPNDLSEMIPDGIDVGKLDSGGTWVDFHQYMGKDQGEAGLTVPTQTMKDGMNQSKDSKMKYSGVIDRPGAKRGTIVVVSRLGKRGDPPFAMNPTEITGTLFHELYHAGQITQGLPYADKDSRFNVVTEAIKLFFRS